jgi:hypothetical protein
MMDFETSRKLTKADRIETYASGYLERAIEAGDLPRAKRAARLIEIAHERASVITMASVRPYRDY